jgi:hypothetical protein
MFNPCLPLADVDVVRLRPVMPLRLLRIAANQFAAKMTDHELNFSTASVAAGHFSVDATTSAAAINPLAAQERHIDFLI